MNQINKLTIDEMESLLRDWEKQDGGWDEQTKEECIELISNPPESDDENAYTLKWWTDFLIPVPKDVEKHYRNLMLRLKNDGVIDLRAYEYELEFMHNFSPKELTRRGTFFKGFLKQSKINHLTR